MTRFIEIRGSTGAGKTTVMRTIMAQSPSRVIDVDKHVMTLRLHGRVVSVPGSYVQTTGGLENRYSLEQCIQLLKHAELGAHAVLFEGGMLSKTTGTVYRWLVDGQKDYHVVHLDVSIPTMVTHLAKRRQHALSVMEMRAAQRDREMVNRAVARIKGEGYAIVYDCDSTTLTVHTILRLIKETKL